ncbi:hypothetical protein [Fluviicola sp.]|uniref:hypothetical protein n=1 Tax=Fluviicola sp. TaxID=1917219 RepID=UPI0031CECCF8
MTDQKQLHKNLIISIIALASDKQCQLDYTIPGCAICDLTEDFYTYGKYCYNPDKYSLEQNIGIGELLSIVDHFCTLDNECFDTDVLDQSDWTTVRHKAKNVLKTFGYELTELPKSVEVKDGFWQVNTLNYELKKIE